VLGPERVPRPEWEPLPRPGCRNVQGKVLLREPSLGLALLGFGVRATIDEHSTDHDVDVICLEGSGFVSVAGVVAPFRAGERIRWPAGLDHCLWTEDGTMQTLMVEHLRGDGGRANTDSTAGG
jgi:quercetin dioxygenase-like cupin family protein